MFFAEMMEIETFGALHEVFAEPVWQFKPGGCDVSFPKMHSGSRPHRLLRIVAITIARCPLAAAYRALFHVAVADVRMPDFYAAVRAGRLCRCRFGRGCVTGVLLVPVDFSWGLFQQLRDVPLDLFPITVGQYIAHDFSHPPKSRWI